MSLPSAACIELDTQLNSDEREKILDKLSTMKGVLSAYFTAKSPPDIWVTYSSEELDVEKQADNIPGIKKISLAP